MAITLDFDSRNLAAIDAKRFVGADLAGVAFNEIKTERQGQDRDDDHEPVAMFSENFNHEIKLWEGGHFKVRQQTCNLARQKSQIPGAKTQGTSNYPNPKSNNLS